MGAEYFLVKENGKTALEAFINAVENAKYNFGHSGYTVTIAEKNSIVEIKLPDNKDPEEYAYELIEDCDSQVSDKWGPAGCIKLKNDEYLFFGLASS